MRIGIDVVSIGRIARLAARPAFLRRVFTEAEQALADRRHGRRRAEWLAGRFAAKEAAAKALGTGFAQGVTPTSIEVLCGLAGEPALVLHGAARDLADALSLTGATLSLSHDGGLAVAVVVLTEA